jgi:hypothetical protein
MDKFEKPKKPDINEEEAIIKNADSFESLIASVKKIKFVRGNLGGLIYDSKIIVDAINDIRVGRLDPSFITTQKGLRDKVVELLEKEKVGK